VKIQLQGQSLRVRLDEEELAGLLEGTTLQSSTSFGNAGVWALVIRLHEGDAATVSAASGPLLVSLPRSAVADLAARLPSRDGIAWEVPCSDTQLHLQFDVDVRDSVRRRGATRRQAVRD